MKTTPKHPTHFLQFCQLEADRLKTIGRHGVAANYRCASHSLRRFLQTRQKHDITIRKLSPILMSDYQNWLWASGVSRNTSSSYMRSLQAIHSKAAAMGIATGNPFQGIYRGIAKTTKRAIRADDIRLIYTLDLPHTLRRQGRDLNNYHTRLLLHRLQFARDIFCFCARGLPFVDLAYLRQTDIRHGHICYARRKTRQPLEVKIEPLMQDIINRYATPHTPYIFPIITDPQRAYAQYRYGLQRYNKSLKLLSDLLQKDLHLTSYVSRHSWATTALYNHVPISVISQAMGHDSERTTAIYLKSLESTQIDQANHTLLTTLFTPT